MGKRFQKRRALRQQRLHPSSDVTEDVVQPVSQSHSLFFRLPREIRDEIYERALGTTSTTLKHGDLTVVVTPTAPTALTTSRNLATTDTIGLPAWFLISKQVCSEALGVFGNTRFFVAKEYFKRDERFSHWPRPRTFLNPLVFNANVVLKIACSTPFPFEATVHRANREFRNALTRLKVEDLCLQTTWIRANERSVWALLGSSGITDLEEWSSFWSGKFKEVELRLMVDCHNAPRVLEKASKLAEVHATRLVGVGGTVDTWSSGVETADGSSYNTWYLVVKRKIREAAD